MDKMLSVVLPAYNEEQMIKKTAQVVGDLLEKEQIPYELVFVNDGSKDHTWEKIIGRICGQLLRQSAAAL